jgi:hypothetical protein
MIGLGFIMRIRVVWREWKINGEERR